MRAARDRMVATHRVTEGFMSGQAAAGGAGSLEDLGMMGRLASLNYAVFSIF